MLLGWMWISDVVLIMFFSSTTKVKVNHLFFFYLHQWNLNLPALCAHETHILFAVSGLFSHLIFSPAVLAFCHSWSPGLTYHKQTMKCSPKKKKCTILEMKTMRIIVLVFLSLQQFMFACNVDWSWHRSITYIKPFSSESELKLKNKFSVKNLNWKNSSFSSESELKLKNRFSVKNLNWK